MWPSRNELRSNGLLAFFTSANSSVISPTSRLALRPASSATSMFSAAPVLGATAFEQPDAAGGNIVGAEKIATAADRPGHRRGVERQRLLDFVEQGEGVE